MLRAQAPPARGDAGRAARRAPALAALRRDNGGGRASSATMGNHLANVWLNFSSILKLNEIHMNSMIKFVKSVQTTLSKQNLLNPNKILATKTSICQTFGQRVATFDCILEPLGSMYQHVIDIHEHFQFGSTQKMCTKYY